MAVWSESVHQQRMLLRGVPGGGLVSARGRRQQFPLAPPRPPAPNPTNTRTCRNNRGDCRLSRSRGGTCRRWGCPGTARCRPVAHSSLRPHRLGAEERCPVAQHERGPLRAALPSTIPPCSSLTTQAPNSGPLHLLCLPLVVPRGFLPARPSLTPECVHTRILVSWYHICVPWSPAGVNVVAFS